MTRIPGWAATARRSPRGSLTAGAGWPASTAAPDLISLPLLADAAAPVVLEVGALSTTVEITVHLRAHPAPGWLACRALTRHVAGGYHEEDFEIWDGAGTLVAQSRQLALVLS